MTEEIKMYACYENQKIEIILKPQESFHGLNMEERFHYEVYKKIGLHPFFQERYMFKNDYGTAGGVFYPHENAEVYLKNEASLPFQTEYGHEFSLTINQETKIREIKNLIQEKIHISIDRLHLFSNNIELDSNNDNLVSFDEKHNYFLFGQYKPNDLDKILVKFIKDKNMDLKIINKTNNDEVIEVSINSMDSSKNLYDLVNKKIGYDITKDNAYILKIGDKYIQYNNQYLYVFYPNFISEKNILTLERLGDFIFVKNLLGHNFIIPRDSSESIMTLKYKIEEIAEIDVDSIRLIFQGKQLEDNRTLEDYNIVKGSIIHLVLRLR
jgi:ubiquitin C